MQQHVAVEAREVEQSPVEDIAQLVWAETGRWEPETLSTWFQWAERLGIGELRGG